MCRLCALSKRYFEKARLSLEIRAGEEREELSNKTMVTHIAGIALFEERAGGLFKGRVEQYPIKPW